MLTLWRCRVRMAVGLMVGVFVLSATATTALELRRMTPEGDDVPPGRQVVLQFDRPVVAVGRMERRAEELPIRIQPALACAWRWLNTTALACQLDESSAMLPATRYRVTIEPGLTALDGTTMTQTLARTFVTQRPTVQYTWFQHWRAPGVPEIQVRFDQPVTGDSVGRHLAMILPNGERVALQVVSASPDRDHDWMVNPTAPLPLDTAIQLRVEPGITPAQGSEPGVESRVVVSFDTFPAFSFLGLACSSIHDQDVTIAPATPLSTQARCNPMRSVYLRFSAPVLKEDIIDVLNIAPSLTMGQPHVDPWADVRTPTRLSWPHRRGQIYTVRLPSMLKAFTTYELHTLNKPILDVFNRPLPTGIQMRFAMDHRPPAYHLGQPVSVLEQQVDTHVPLYVTNLDNVHLKYQTMTAETRQVDRQHDITLEKVEDVSHAIPLKIRDLLPASSGALQGYLSTTPPVGKPQWFFSQVTPFHVHVKLGHYNTLVWVTDLSTGTPVPGAQVQICRGKIWSEVNAVALTEAMTDETGVAMLAGTETLDPNLAVVNNWRRHAAHLTVRVQHQGELALMPLYYDFAVSTDGPSYIPSSLQRRYGHIHTWGTTAQGVYKAGDTVQFTFYVRNQDNMHFMPAPPSGYHLKVYAPTDKVVHEVKALHLSEFGGYHGEFTAPATGAVGWYRFELSLEGHKHRWEPLRVLISDFTPAPFRVTTDLHGKQFKVADTVTVTTQAKLHAGGPYADAKTRVTAQIRGLPLEPQSPQLAQFWFDVMAGSGVQTIFQTRDTVDATGTLQTSFSIREAQALYGRLVVESAVQDDRGKAIAGRATARYVGRDRYVGVHQQDWVLRVGVPADLDVVVVDEHAAAVAGTPAEVKIDYLQVKAARVKGAGNAYLTQYTREWVHVASCTLISAAVPAPCQFRPTAPGRYRMTASVTDTQGRLQSSSLERWAVGRGEVVWETKPGHALDMSPEKTSYTIGDTARFLVQNPYPGAQALVTIERFGVQRSWLQPFANSLEVIEVPITEAHLPGFYLSVVVMSPRVAQPLGDNQVDLGKPAFRIGYVRVPVRDQAKALVIDVTPEQATYKPRETASVKLHVTTRQGDRPPVELAVAVLDEAVFDLIQGGRGYFDPYAGFYTLDALDMRNYNLLTRLIGIQKFEKKGANPGGGGGGGPQLRSLFKFVSYWNPSLRPDADGHATIRFLLPDNLTGWRVLAMAVTASDRMGLGEGHVAVNQPTELRPALPNQVTEGDRFEARFTVMNRTEATRRLTVSIDAEGPIEPAAPTSVSVLAEPYQRYTVGLPLQTRHAGDLVLQARAGDAEDQDGLLVHLPIRKRQTLDVGATYGSTTADKVTETIAFPQDIRTDVGHVSMVVSPSVIGGVEGAFAYMRDYPYICWEQKLTKGVMASHFQRLKRYLPASLAWPDSAALPEQTLALASSYQAPNGGMTYYKPQNQYVSPYLSAYTAVAFNWLRQAGYAIPEHVEKPLHQYLQTLLRRDVMPDFYTKGMSSTVRAVALAALAPHGRLTRHNMSRYQRHVPQMSLFGKAHYLLALTEVADTASMQKDVVRMIQSYGHETGGKFVFSDTEHTRYARLLASPLRSNCAVLSALLAHQSAAGASLSDIPFKLTRTITQSRKHRSHWENTQENMFCMQALIAFSQSYERETPHMALQTFLDDNLIGQTSFQDFKDTAVEMQHPIGEADPGRKALLTLKRDGQGRVYYAARLHYAPKTLPTNPINAGMTIHREYSVERQGEWLLLQSPMQLRQGELARVDLYLSLPAARNFVVVDDPVPGGLEPVNRQLATASTVDADQAKMAYAKHAFWYRYNDWRAYGYSHWSFYHQELRHHAARFYSEYLPPGRYHLSYVAQAIAPGEFTVLPTRAEEMYDPDVFGQGRPGMLKIGSAKDAKGLEGGR
jgi:uncharacterized protein YfaS (alpha-2-macroglobulin family)